MAIIVKHLPGQHDQMTHGNRYNGKKPKTRLQAIDEMTARDALLGRRSSAEFDRDYWDNFNQEGPVLVYHGTAKGLAKVINKGGLKRGRTWMDRPPSVYFTVDEREAKQWRSGVIVEFYIPDEWDNDIITDAVGLRDFDWESSFRIERDIPPENIKSIKVMLGFNESGLLEYGDIMERKERVGYAPIICHFTEEKSKRIVIKKGSKRSGHWGHRGRPGKVGGSMPKGGPGKDKFRPSIGTHTSSYADPPPAYPGKHDPINEFLNQGLEIQEPFLYSGTSHAAWATASYEERGKMKADIVSEISEQTGVDDDIVNEILAQWADTSNDEDMRSLSLQKAASEEFDVNMSGWQLSKYVNRLERWEEIETEWEQEKQEQFDWLMEKRSDLQAQGIDNPITQASRQDIRWQANYQARTIIKNRYDATWMAITSRNDERLVLRAMYDITQAEFMKAGFDRDDYVTIWRGIGKVDVGRHNELVSYNGNAIESWSAAYKVGLDFRNIGGDVVGALVPVRNILGTCKTGFGCWTEGEIVTFGTIPGMQVRVIDPGELFQAYQASKKEQEFSDKAMIALPVTDPAVMELWREFGSSEEVLPLHVTLLYLGEVEGLDKDEIINILYKFTQQQAPIEGKYGGAAIFTDNGDGYPHVLLFDSPQLPFCFSTLSNLLLPHRPELTHGFTPHTTLAYQDTSGDLPVDVDIPYTFSAIMLKWGDEERIFPLLGDVVHKGGEGSGHHGHKGRPGKIGGSLPADSLPFVSSDKKDVELSKELAKECMAIPKECYKNSAMALVRVKGGKYVEGYFVIDMGDFQYPVEHGWLEKPDGTIIDITLPDDKGTYIPAYSWTLKDIMSKMGEDGVTLPFSNYNDENWRKAAVQAWSMLGVVIEKHLPGQHDQMTHGNREGRTRKIMVGDDELIIDKGIASLVSEMNKMGLITAHSCSGHVCDKLLSSEITYYVGRGKGEATHAKLLSLLESGKLNLGWRLEELPTGNLPRYSLHPKLGLFGAGELFSEEVIVDKAMRDWNTILDVVSSTEKKHIRVIKGGPGSGHHGHAGRPGKVGGSAPSEGSKRMIGAHLMSMSASAHSYTLDKADPDPRDNPKEIVEGRRMSWHNAMSIVNKTIVKQSAFSEQPDEPIKEMYADWLTYHDAKVGNKLRYIVVPENNAEWLNEYNRTFDDGKDDWVVGFFNRKFDQVTIKPRSAEIMADVFHHEMGHLAYNHSIKKVRWYRPWRDDADFDRHTAYSLKNVSEGFCESYMLYIRGEGLELGVYREAYDVVQEVIDGVR